MNTNIRLQAKYLLTKNNFLRKERARYDKRAKAEATASTDKNKKDLQSRSVLFFLGAHVVEVMVELETASS